MKTSRRKFMRDAFKATVAGSISLPFIYNSANAKNTFLTSDGDKKSVLQFVQIPLPYSYTDLEPNIDALTMEIHYSKHHATYIKNINEAIGSENITYADEKDFFANASKLSDKARNNGGGSWNHNFFWQIMKPKGEGLPTGKIGDAINGGFGSFDNFKQQFSKAATTQFGSGWAWLVNDNGKLKVGSTPNQDNPLMDISSLKGTPLLALDVWEHAYYLKYQNKRADYIANWWNVVNWDAVAKRLENK